MTSSPPLSPADIDSVVENFKAGEATIGVVGLGYVGLPLVKASIEAGYRAIGVDIDPSKIEALKAGRNYIRHLSAESLGVAVSKGRFMPTTDFAKLADADAVIICVPTPLTVHRDPDLSFVENTARAIAPHLTRGQLIVLESTTYPGTTRDVVKPILEKTGFVSGKGFFLAYSPEREDPGNIEYSTSRIPKVVGGDGPDALRIANALYSRLITRTVPVSSLEVAEATKLTENIFRSVNIALVNELKVLYAAMGVDVWEVIEAAKTKPFGFMPFYPGPGLGGHCIPIDPFYLTWKAHEYELSTRFIELAGEVNTNMPRYVVARLADELDARFARGLNGAKVLVLGIAYKKNVDDTRESPSLKLIELLEKRGAVCDIHDPFVPAIPMTREHPSLAGRASVVLDPKSLAAYDVILVSTDHDAVDYDMIVRNAKLVVDTRNVCARLGVSGDNIAKA